MYSNLYKKLTTLADKIRDEVGGAGDSKRVSVESFIQRKRRLSEIEDKDRKERLKELEGIVSSQDDIDTGENPMGTILEYMKMFKENLSEGKGKRNIGGSNPEGVDYNYGNQPDNGDKKEKNPRRKIFPSRKPRKTQTVHKSVKKNPLSVDLDRVAVGIKEAAEELGIDPVDLATMVSYETGGTFDPLKKGPITMWGQHRGLIQFGEPQAKKFGVDWNDPYNSQLGKDGAIVKYFRSSGFKKGMGILDLYSIINAGGPGRYSWKDEKSGGAPGTVADKVQSMLKGAHRKKAVALMKRVM